MLDCRFLFKGIFLLEFMGEAKKDFINFLLQNGLFLSDSPATDRTLKSRRISPWFLNIGDFNDGMKLLELSRAYSQTIIDSGIEVDSLYGIPEKGVGLVGPVATELARRGTNVGWFFTRKMPKEHGEATGKTDMSKMVVGRAPREGELIGQLDDVFTAGDAKYEARQVLQELGDFQLPLLAIALDRQEVGIDGKSAIEEYEAKTGTRVVSCVSAVDVLNHLKGHFEANKEINYSSGEVFMNAEQLSKRIERLSNYLRVYGTEPARRAVGKLEGRIISGERSVIPACDVETIEQYEELVKQTADVEGIGGFKVGFELGLTYGLPRIVEVTRKHTDKPIIYDHQKAGTDIPDTGRNFARACSNAGVDAVILFPQAGPETARAWIYHALDYGLQVIVGGRMTHPAYAVSEGGFITDEGAMEMYKIAARAGITNFVVPGNKPEIIKQVREAVEGEIAKILGAEETDIASFYAPGFVAQGGKISDAAAVAGDRFHGIVGRGIYQAEDMNAAAIEYTSQVK